MGEPLPMKQLIAIFLIKVANLAKPVRRGLAFIIENMKLRRKLIATLRQPRNSPHQIAQRIGGLRTICRCVVSTRLVFVGARIDHNYVPNLESRVSIGVENVKVRQLRNK